MPSVVRRVLMATGLGVLLLPGLVAAQTPAVAGPAAAAPREAVGKTVSGAARDAELDTIGGLLPGRYLGTVPDPGAPAGSPPLRVYHQIVPVQVPQFGPGRALYHQISRDGFDSPAPFQQKLYLFDESADRPDNRMRAFVLPPGVPSVSPDREPGMLARLDPARTLRFPPGCEIRWRRAEQPDTYIARVRREDCRYRSERFGQDVSPDLTYVVSPGWLAVEDLLYGEDGEALVPSPGLARAQRLEAGR